MPIEVSGVSVPGPPATVTAPSSPMFTCQLVFEIELFGGEKDAKAKLNEVAAEVQASNVAVPLNRSNGSRLENLEVPNVRSNDITGPGTNG